MRTSSQRIVVACAVTAFALAAAGCGGDSDSDGEPAATEAPAAEPTDLVDPVASEVPAVEVPVVEGDDPIKIGLVAPSAENDLAWTQSMFDSLNRVAEERDIEIAVSGGLVVVDDAAAALRGYAEDGFDLVIAHGTQFGGPLQEVADDFPAVSFAIGTSTDFFGKPNVFAYSVDAGQGGYVNGVMAAQLTSSNVIGVVGPVPVGDAKLYIDGFVSGATTQRPDVQVNVTYIDSFSDLLLASEAAMALVANGADVLTGTAQMVPGAVGVAEAASIPWFGTQSNQTILGADIVVASQVYHWEVLIDRILDKIAAGTPGGEALAISFADGGLEMQYNDGFALDAAIRVSADETVARISDGSIIVSE